MNKGELYYHLNKKNIVQVIETDGDNIIIDFFKQKQYLMSGTDELIRTECDQFEFQIATLEKFNKYFAPVGNSKIEYDVKISYDEITETKTITEYYKLKEFKL
jgi:hypothetical protein